MIYIIITDKAGNLWGIYPRQIGTVGFDRQHKRRNSGICGRKLRNQ